jgi:hypothetical protein
MQTFRLGIGLGKKPQADFDNSLIVGVERGCEIVPSLDNNYIDQIRAAAEPLGGQITKGPLTPASKGNGVAGAASVPPCHPFLARFHHFGCHHFSLGGAFHSCP